VHVHYRGDSDQTLLDSESESPSPGSEPLAPDLGRPGSSSRHSVIRLDRTRGPPASKSTSRYLAPGEQMLVGGLSLQKARTSRSSRSTQTRAMTPHAGMRAPLALSPSAHWHV
jgi:hypothetical protein